MILVVLNPQESDTVRNANISGVGNLEDILRAAQMHVRPMGPDFEVDLSPTDLDFIEAGARLWVNPPVAKVCKALKTAAERIGYVF